MSYTRPMHIYLVTRKDSKASNQYISFIVLAESIQQAINIHPSDKLDLPNFNKLTKEQKVIWFKDWCEPEQCECTLLGFATPKLAEENLNEVKVLHRSYYHG